MAMTGWNDRILAKAVDAPLSIPAGDLAGMLSTADSSAWEEAFAAAREVKRRVGRDRTLPRGLIECSNVCAKGCLYCGIRKSAPGVRRYRLSVDEVLACVDEARRRGYRAIALQAGELEGEANAAFYERILRAVAGEFEVTLSLGEQEEAVYRRWKDAGAMRYLIRIETSRRDLYARLHPADCSFDRRVACIRTLKRLGYVTGTGVMIGLPGQTAEDLARDLVFFGEERVDMVGMGPFIPHPATPLAAAAVPDAATRLELALRMIALARLYLHDVNIVAATALEALDPANGRARGLAAGANVIMPNVTPPDVRRGYDLYPGKAEA